MVACAEPSREAIVAAPLVHAARVAPAPPAPDASRVAEVNASVPIDAAYTRDVWVVVTPPLAVYLLARFDEIAEDGGAAFDCERALLRHAQSLGANRLYVDRAATCRGAAYFVPLARGSDTPPQATRAEQQRIDADYSATLHEWVRARWHRPSGMPESESSRLCVVVQFSTSDQLRIWNVRAVPILSSGNRAFDASVHDALESAIDEHASLPEPQTQDDARRFRRAQVRFAFSEGNLAGCR